MRSLAGQTSGGSVGISLTDATHRGPGDHNYSAQKPTQELWSSGCVIRMGGAWC